MITPVSAEMTYGVIGYCEVWGSGNGVDLGTANTLVYVRAAASSSSSPRWSRSTLKTARSTPVRAEAKQMLGPRRQHHRDQAAEGRRDRRLDVTEQICSPLHQAGALESLRPPGVVVCVPLRVTGSRSGRSRSLLSAGPARRTYRGAMGRAIGAACRSRSRRIADRRHRRGTTESR